jgi:hypothetical protein
LKVILHLEFSAGMLHTTSDSYKLKKSASLKSKVSYLMGDYQEIEPVSTPSCSFTSLKVSY